MRANLTQMNESLPEGLRTKPEESQQPDIPNAHDQQRITGRQYVKLLTKKIRTHKSILYCLKI